MTLTTPIARTLDTVADKYGMPRELVRAVANVETGGTFNPLATNKSSGAMGLMQLMPDTAAAYKLTDPYDPAQNASAGTRFLKSLALRFGAWEPALAAYNWGPEHVAKAPDPVRWPTTVQDYVRKVYAKWVPGAAPQGLTHWDVAVGPAEITAPASNEWSVDVGPAVLLPDWAVDIGPAQIMSAANSGRGASLAFGVALAAVGVGAAIALARR